MSQKPLYARIDLHCHSWASDKPTLWFMQRLGCPESFTNPEHLREIALQRGMNFITITDHDTLDGVRDIENYDNVITGCEVTTRFPGDIKIHVICLNITHEQFDKIDSIRHNIFDFVEYINDQHILHFLAHPLHRVNDRLTWDHFEQLMLLFKRMEILNGSRLRRLNLTIGEIIQNLTPETIEQWSKKHGIEPVGERPWEKFLVGGTDDHSGLFIGTCYTEVEVKAMTREALLEGIRLGKTRAVGTSEGFLPLAHQVNSIAFQYYRSKIGPESSEMFYLLNRIFERNRPAKISSMFKVQKVFKKVTKFFYKPKQNLNLIDEVRDVIKDNVALKTLFHGGMMTSQEFNANVFQLSSDILDEMILRVYEKPKLIQYFILLAPVVITSYLMVCRNLHGERDLILTAEKWLGKKRKPKVAWFTDSFVNMDGVSKTCNMFLQAARSRDMDLTIVTCHKDNLDHSKGVKNFKPIKEFPTPGYEKVALYLPSILQVIKYIEDEEFDSIVLSTPGPVGLLGLVCAKLMRVPVCGIYHTDLPRIALQVTGDPMIGEAACILSRLFYKYVDRVFCPSKWYVEDIGNLGVEPEKTDILERWVDTDLFTPRRRQENYWKTKAAVKLLFVGRISKDKNIDALIDLYEYLVSKQQDFVLHVVGDGPYFDEFKNKTSHFKRLVMTGPKFKDDLAAAYASSDLFVYPGLLDTFGNVVVEAQASGLPCVVMNEGGPQELISHGETGLVANSTKQFIQTVEKLILDVNLRSEMSRNAAAYAGERFAEERIFNRFWETITTMPQGNASKSDFPFLMKREPVKVVSLPA